MMGPGTLPGVPDYGALLAAIAAHGAPVLSVPAMPPTARPGDNALLSAAQGGPAPVPRPQSAFPAAGGIAPPPTPIDGNPPPYYRPSAPPEPDLATVLASFGPKPLSKGQVLAGILGDALAGAAGRPGQFAEMMKEHNQQEATRGNELVRWQLERRGKREDALQPRMEEVGDAVGWLDPAARSFDPIYQKAQPFEAYARAQGLEPGTPEYAHAVEDYRLGSWSDPAMENRLGLESTRQGYRRDLQDDRLTVTRRGQDLSHGDRVRGQGINRQNNIRSTGQSNTNNIRSTQASRANNAQSNNTRLRTAKRVSGGPVLVNTPEEARALPPGTMFMTPDGRVKQR